MKKIFPLLFLVLLFPAAAEEKLPIPAENRVILEANYPHQSSWTPTDEQIAQALQEIISYLENPAREREQQAEEIKKIRQHLGEYHVQVIGYEKEGKKYLWLNFFSEQDGWQEKPIIVLDGGFWFWQVEYDPNKQKVIRFSSNGYA